MRSWRETDVIPAPPRLRQTAALHCHRGGDRTFSAVAEGTDTTPQWGRWGNGPNKNRSRSKQTDGTSFNVPWTRTLATVPSQCSAWSFRSSSDTNSRPWKNPSRR